MTDALVPEAGGGEIAVSIRADIVLTGALAQFGRSTVVNDVATRLTSEFARCLQDKLGAATTAEAAAVKAGKINIVRVVLAVLRERILAVLRRLFGRPPPT